MREFRSWRSYHHFAEAVTHHARHFWAPEVGDFLQTLLDTSEKRNRAMSKGHVLWRAQLGEGEPWPVKDDEEPMSVAHPSERMKPRPRRATEGRANPKGIPYLYLSDDRDTAMAEIRPWVGTSVSVAQFRVVKDLKVLHFTSDPVLKRRRIWISSDGYFEPSAVDRDEAVWRDIDSAFAEPTERSDDDAEYAPTQIIAEFLRHKGFDGIAYRSGLGPGTNVALFDLESARQVNGFLFSSRRISFAFEEISNPYFIREETSQADVASDSGGTEPEASDEGA